jgi:hypothetical protein
VLFFELFPALVMVVSLIVGIRLFVVSRSAADDARDTPGPVEASPADRRPDEPC